jgi:hypothetical protein
MLRLIVQRVLEAFLLVDEAADAWAHAAKGVIVYVSILKGSRRARIAPPRERAANASRVAHAQQAPRSPTWRRR